MTDNGILQGRARLSITTGVVFAALVVLSTSEVRVDARPATAFVATDLGTLGDGSPDCPPCFSEAFAVNDKGLVVGRSATSRDPNVFRAFVWSENTGMQDLLRGHPTLGVSSQSWATVIAGDVIA